MPNNNSQWVESTFRQALYLWVGLSLALTLFFVQSQMFFIQAEPLPHSNLEWIMTALGSVTFLLALFFFRNYTAVRKSDFLKMPASDRKQSILIAFVLQFVLLETLGLFGVFISVFTQNTTKAIPYIVAAYIGFLLSWPSRKKIEPFF